MADVFYFGLLYSRENECNKCQRCGNQCRREEYGDEGEMDFQGEDDGAHPPLVLLEQSQPMNIFSVFRDLSSVLQPLNYVFERNNIHSLSSF